MGVVTWESDQPTHITLKRKLKRTWSYPGAADVLHYCVHVKQEATGKGIKRLKAISVEFKVIKLCLMVYLQNMHSQYRYRRHTRTSLWYSHFVQTRIFIHVTIQNSE
jgi:hypothetical protein